MGRKLSLFCPCLPQKPRDNLSSRSLYLDDSSGQEDYSDDDNEYMRLGNEHPQQGSRARLQSLLARPSAPYPKSTSPPLENAWPSSLSNGRFSRHSGRNKNQRKPNPFQAPYRDDDSDNNDAEEEDEDGYPDDLTAANDNQSIDRRGRRRRRTSFKPYRDDDSGDEQSPRRVSGNARGTHAQSAHFFSPVEVAPVPQRMHVPKNTQGEMIWGDDGEEVIDVDALLAEQERISKDLAAQEEALREKEEAVILAKRRAAIQAAERKGLLRLYNDDQPKSLTGEEESSVAHDGDAWIRSTSLQTPQSISKASATGTSSRASSYVGDGFDQDLKMMTLDINNKTRSTPTVSATSENLASDSSQRILSDAVSLSKMDGAAIVDSSDDTNSKHGKPANDGQSTIPGLYSTATADPFANGQGTLAIHTETDDIYPVDPFNPSSPPEIHKVHDQQYPADKVLPSTPKNKDQDKEPTSGDKVTDPQPEQLNPEQQQTTVAGTSERIMGTFTSIFNTGSSLMGYFGSGHQETEQVSDRKMDSGNGRLSEVKAENPTRRHFFDYSAAAASVASAAVAAVVGQSSAKKPPADDDDNSSIDDYDF